MPPAAGAFRDNLAAGGVFVAIGAAFAVGASRYELGTALNMGPGYLPLVLGLVLVTLGLVIVGQGVMVRVRAMRAADPAAPADLASGSAATDRQAAGSAATDQPAAASPAAGTAVAVESPEPTRGPVPWLRGGLLVAAVLLFGLTVRGRGSGPGTVRHRRSWRPWPVPAPDRSAPP